MSAFDDEFGLFGETAVDDVERQPTRREEAPPREPVPAREPAPARAPRAPERRPRKPSTAPGDPWAGHRRATELLAFLARKLVQKPDSVSVELFIDEHAQPVIELIVDPEDLGKVIGRSGRVAQALRTVVRATAEGRVAVDILDTTEAAEGLEDESE
ncbi:MAG: KH domain-containing protein [Candidatus Eremiobacteraeota bacterium]|nr:KH domain-containing protein [Candidatus Eremiobacteraeota bacterium]MBV8497839.1 KH domain-containing protein [Candidatus Eremiobacteraeota bacterium]